MQELNQIVTLKVCTIISSLAVLLGVTVNNPVTLAITIAVGVSAFVLNCLKIYDWAIAKFKKNRNEQSETNQ